MYEGLTKRLRNCISDTVEDCAGCPYQGGYKGTYCMNGLIEEAADAIEELEKACEEAYNKGLLEGGIAQRAEDEKWLPKWIPVTERPPKKDVPVFVYLFGDSPYIAWINREGEWETEEFTIDHDYLPKAWMPLPEPPKEGT